MKDKIHKALLEDGPCLSPEELRDYHESRLSPEAQHRVEAHALHCDLCSEALDGLATAGLTAEEFSADVEEINNRAWNHVEALSRKSNRRPWIWMSAACVLFIAVSVSWFLYQGVSQDQQMEAVFAEQFSLPAADSALLATARMGGDSLLGNESGSASGDVLAHLQHRSVADPGANLVNREDQKMVSHEDLPPPMPSKALSEAGADEVSITDKEESASETRKVTMAPPYPANGAAVVTEKSKNADDLAFSYADESVRSEDAKTTGRNSGGKDVSSKEGNQKGKPEKKTSDVAGLYKPAAPAKGDVSAAQLNDANISPMADSVSVTMTVAKPNLLLSGLGAYNAQDYKSAVDQFNEVLKVEPYHQEANFYAGVSYLGLNDAPKAIPCLERARTGTNPSLGEDAEWYLSLAYLKVKNKNKAEPLLKTIESRSDGRYRSRAAEALDDLRNP
jgi:hypothetical protein